MHPARTIAVASARKRFGESSTELAMVTALERHLGTTLLPAVITIDDDTRFEVEASDAERSIFVQMVANTGEFKSAHRNRVTANLFKLAWIRHSLFPEARHVLCVTTSVAPAFTPTGWTAVATRDLGVDVLVFDPDTGEIDVGIRAANDGRR